jgi:hypothetical protein
MYMLGLGLGGKGLGLGDKGLGLGLGDKGLGLALACHFTATPTSTCTYVRL